MAKNISAGLLIWRKNNDQIEVLLVHPGGPFWAKKDEGVWSIPKGLIEEGEDILKAAERETEEETGFSIDGENFIDLDEVKMKSGKIIHAWAVEGNFDVSEIKSNDFEIEWPPRSGKKQKFPEVDRGEYFDIKTAKIKIVPAQTEFIKRLMKNI